jgi:hypothetical protein
VACICDDWEGLSVMDALFLMFAGHLVSIKGVQGKG